MTKETKYLHITVSSLLIRYAAIFVAFVLVMVFSGRSPLKLAVIYWGVCIILIALESSGSYLKIADGKLVWVSWHLYRFSVPLHNISSVQKGTFYGIGHPECITLKYTLPDGKSAVGYLLPSQYRRQDIRRFVADLSKASPTLVVDKNIEKWF